MGSLVGNLWTPGRGSDGRITQASWDALPTDTWVSIAGTGFVAQVQPLLTAALPGYNDPGSTDLSSVLDAYAGFAHDEVGGRLFGHAGGHQNSANNGIYCCDLAKMAWSIKRLPDMQTDWPANYKTNPPRDNTYTSYTNAADYCNANPTTTVANSDQFYDPITPAADTRNPTARHTYSAMTFYGGVLRHGVRNYWQWTEATDTWATAYPFGKNYTTHSQAGGGYAGSLVKGTWDEVKNRYLCTPTSVGAPGTGWAWNQDSGTWTKPAGLVGGWEGYWSAFARRGRDWCSFARPTMQGAFWPPTLRVMDLDADTLSSVVLSGLVQANCMDANKFDESTAMTYCAANGKFFVLMRYDINNTYAATATLPLEAFWIDPVAGTMTHEVQTGAFPVISFSVPVENKLLYVEQLRCLLLVPTAASNILIRKMA